METENQTERADLAGALASCVDFARRLIRTPSMSGAEAAVAAVVAAEMRALGFDAVHLDGAGNVEGRVRGREPGLGALVLNSHLDIVDPGDPALWSVPPYAAEIVAGRIVGRGAADIKGPMAVQVHAVGALLAAGERPRRDVVVSAVVDEEVGGGGARHWAAHVDYPVDLIVLGEPSSNALAVGHRGIAQLWVTFHGQSAHASAPERAVNPNYALARFLTALPDAASDLPAHPVLGPTTVAPTLVEVDTRSPNVTPAWTRVMLDFRTAGASCRDLVSFIGRVAGDWPHSVADAWSTGSTGSTGPGAPDGADLDSTAPIVGFYTSPEGPPVVRARACIERGMGRAPAVTTYRFATDGRHFAGLGAAIVGYSAADEDQAHVAGESIAIDRMSESLRGHLALLKEY
jgi:succinyl-diaminopimelate desuccinylase